MSATVKRQDMRPYIHIGWIGAAFLAFGIGQFLRTFGGVFDLYDQVEPLIKSGAITEAQAEAFSTVPGSTKGVTLFSAIIALVGLLTTTWAMVAYLRRSKP